MTEFQSLPRRDATRTRPHARRRGFTLVELLVVIGILLLLISLAVIGFRTVGTAAKTRVTNTALENCKSMLGEYTLVKSVKELLPNPPVASGHWVVPTPAPAENNAATLTVAAPTPGSVEETNLVQDIARVMAVLRAVSRNRESLDKMPPDRVRGVTYGTLGTLPASTTAVPVMVDAQNNPIYFVPGGGLTGVNRGYKGAGDRTAAASYDQSNQRIVAPDRLPFWVSAGPDGNLTTGDDNQYSFGE